MERSVTFRACVLWQTSQTHILRSILRRLPPCEKSFSVSLTIFAHERNKNHNFCLFNLTATRWGSIQCQCALKRRLRKSFVGDSMEAIGFAWAFARVVSSLALRSFPKLPQAYLSSQHDCGEWFKIYRQK